MMRTLIFICAAAAVLAALYAIHLHRRLRRLERELAGICAQTEHFLLYSSSALGETLDEGGLANFSNSVSKLEQHLLHERALGRRREREVTHFVENMAHQMKNAVTALQIQLELFEMQTSPEQCGALEKSEVCLERLTGEIDRVLRSSQLAAGKIAMKLEPFELTHEIELCAERLAPIAKQRRAVLRIEYAERTEVYADLFWMGQAIENIIKNALEHTAPDTVVTAARDRPTVLDMRARA